MEHLDECQAQWLKTFNLEDPKSLSQFIMDDYSSKLISKRDEALQIKIKERLSFLGYVFSSQIRFETFCSERIMLIQIGQFQKELYLDYVSEDDKGIFIISYKDEITLDYSEIHNQRLSMDIKMTIG
jgi:hypothetical protein